MCDFHQHETDLTSLSEDEFVLDNLLMRDFVASIRARLQLASTPAEACSVIEQPFRELLANEDWLPSRYQEPATQGGMGGGIGQWLLFRAADRSLCMFSLVVPPGSMTPIHDHLAWGLIGLYRGTQDEEFYRPDEASLVAQQRRPLATGDLYALIPPDNDIHRVRTTSSVTSVSIHLLANDTGCVLRHTFDETTGQASPFRSGYVNAECEGTLTR
jgi:3-mercaptopropionate dioxygenase